jgi:hypothetical protein
MAAMGARGLSSLKGLEKFGQEVVAERKTRKQWRGWITGGIAEAQKLVDAYFDEAFKLVSDGKGKPIYPSRLKF